MDVAGIQPGKDFRVFIDQSVARCSVFLAIIGRRWLTVADATGARRLDSFGDFVRLEVASALARNIPIIPVLVQGASMPASDDLPEPLRDLAYRHGVELTLARWNSDVALLVAALKQYVQVPPDVGTRTSPTTVNPSNQAPPKTFTPARIATATAAILATVLSVIFAFRHSRTPAPGLANPHQSAHTNAAPANLPASPNAPAPKPAGNPAVSREPNPAAVSSVKPPPNEHPTTQFQVKLPYNTIGIYPDGAQFDPYAGIAGTNSAFHPFNDLLKPGTNLLPGPDGSLFRIGRVAQDDVLQASDDTPTVIQLPAQRYKILVILGAASPSSVAKASFYVNYADRNELHSQSISAFEATDAPRFSGEEIALTQTYANSFDGTRVLHYYDGQGTQVPIRNSLYLYHFQLDPTQPLKSLTLPQNPRILIFAITLVP